MFDAQMSETKDVLGWRAKHKPSANSFHDLNFMIFYFEFIATANDFGLLAAGFPTF